jgi:hypothetical protein
VVWRSSFSFIAHYPSMCRHEEFEYDVYDTLVMVMVRILRLSLLTLETICVGLLMSLPRFSFFLVERMVISRLMNSVLNSTTIPPFWNRSHSSTRVDAQLLGVTSAIQRDQV